MNPASQSPSGGRERREGADEVDTKVSEDARHRHAARRRGHAGQRRHRTRHGLRRSMKQTTNTGSVTVSQR